MTIVVVWSFVVSADTPIHSASPFGIASVSAPRPPPLVVSVKPVSTTTDLGMKFTLVANVSGGSGTPTNWNYAWNNLPSGCASVNNSSQPCTANASGFWNVSVTVHDRVTGQTKTSANVSVTINPALVIVQVTSSGGWNVTLNYTVAISTVVSGGTPPISYAYSGLPSGCVGTTNSTTNCHPTAVGTYTFTVTVHDSVGAAASYSGTLTVRPLNGTPSYTVTTQRPIGAATYAEMAGILIVGAIIAILLLLKARRDEKATFAAPKVGGGPVPWSPAGGTSPPPAEQGPPPSEGAGPPPTPPAAGP